MTVNQIELVVTSYPDDYALVAELWCDLGLFATIHLLKQDQTFVMELYPVAGGRGPCLKVAEFEEFVQLTKQRSLAIDGISTDPDT